VPTGKQATHNQKEVHTPIAGLSAVFLTPTDILLGDEDYRKLCTNPELKAVRQRFWRDRRRIVLMWVGELQRDIHILWKFRRFLVRNGLLVTFREEVAIVFEALLALLFSKVVRAVVFFFGPFVLHGALGSTRFLVEGLSTSVVAPLTRVPASRKAEIELRWIQQLPAMGMRTI
jgi:hypothetical protein